MYNEPLYRHATAEHMPKLRRVYGECPLLPAQGDVALPPAAEQAVEDAAASRNTDLQQRALELQALLRCAKARRSGGAVDTVTICNSRYCTG